MPLRNKCKNRKPNCRQYFSMYSAHWPPNKPKALANLVSCNNKAGKVLFSLYFWTSTASQMQFQHQQKLPVLITHSNPQASHLPPLSGLAAPGAPPGSKAISLYCSCGWQHSTQRKGSRSGMSTLSTGAGKSPKLWACSLGHSDPDRKI